jgi:enoyl-CoA hydratase/carnithine racemase
MTDQLTATEPVLYELCGAVALLTLNRPERLNAWSNDLEDRYFELLDRIEDDPDVRAVVVTGAGRGFCAGADMDDLDLVGSADLELTLARPRPQSFPLSVRKPMIAALNGAAAGLGLVQALYCDIRFATPTAKLTTAFALRGLIAEHGISWILPRLVGQANALDLLLSGRVVRGEEALAMGLVNRLVAPEALVDEAVEYARSLADASSPVAMATIKQQVQRHMDSTLAHAIAESDALMRQSFEWPDVREGVSSYLEGRPPAFPSLPARS